MECDVPRVSTRELCGSRAEQLQRISDAGLVAQGRVFLLSLEPIKVQIGAKWPSRSEVIWDAVERALAKSMPPPDVYVRLTVAGDSIWVHVPRRLKFRGGRAWLEGEAPKQARPSRALIKALKQAHQVLDGHVDDDGVMH